MSELKPAVDNVIPTELLAQASSMHLCIHLHPQWVCATVADAASGQIQWTSTHPLERHHAERWEDVLAFVKGRNWSEKVFRKCTLTYDTPDFALIPSAFFEKARELSLLEFQTGKKHKRTDDVHISELQAELVYEPEKELRELIARFPNARIFPVAYLFARYAFMNSEKNQQIIHVLNAPSHILLCIFNNKQLQLLNHYDANAEEDVLYHTANASMRLGIDMEHVPIRIYSYLPATRLLDLFRNYSRDVIQVLPSSGQPVVTQMHVSCV